MPLLAVLANRRTRRSRYHKNMVLPMIAGGIAAGVSGAVANRLLHNGRRARKNFDPNACLRDIDDFLKSRKSGDEVDYMVEDLYRWLQRGGFAPIWKDYPLGTSYFRTRLAGAKRKGNVRRNPDGFYVMGKYQSVAWCATRAEADEVAKRLNYSGGTVYTVVPAGKIGVGRIAASHRSRNNPLSRREAALALKSARGDFRRGASYPKGSPRRKFLMGRASGKAAVVTDTAQGHRTKYIAGSFETKAYSLQNRADGTITLPFKQGRKYSIESVNRWVQTHGTPAMKKRWAMALAQYKRFHKGSLPKFITYQTYKMGSHPGISDVEFGVSEGREWMAAYQVPASSGKWVDAASGGRYVHAHGDSEIDVDVKRPVSLKKLPMRFHTPDGKAVGVIPSSNVKIGEWYEG